jgi:hypothetical protein
MQLYVLSTWYNTRGGDRETKLVEVADAAEAHKLAAEYRTMSVGSSDKVDHIVLIEGQPL